MQVFAQTIAFDRALLDVMLDRNRLVVNVVFEQLFGLRFFRLGIDDWIVVAVVDAFAGVGTSIGWHDFDGGPRSMVCCDVVYGSLFALCDIGFCSWVLFPSHHDTLSSAEHSAIVSWE